ncbi:bifunctional phosphoribosyl-AMP cyclohydrolase/phosphoribosyl-ATP pyrophosphatase protein [Fictibacillus macauensis ZFHKF-1]|uniref:Histidine biosynthesis bifunctional protein HisIE n=1 Tax=Fictibacillus macauensis ZFHKF-1 TaxID=1196324 RepID=I8UJM8_9BACL|nr:bifunctional phosphoribosyl-AMP cyclohydrolase/phosphoribosyl-ATP diphosphatase HisIE [Fictibacillus macauensis]EIT87018.1 bifunctional phosphoribosyl-AMP cyclohydrolase/phosphoribosyl-ATP pyrophosphatase protein [Fictibacillus macauensis ZFHKF-1]
MQLDKVVFDKQGLLPVIVQHVETKEVLTLAYMNEEALQETMKRGETVFYSRSRQTLWHKGETSGNRQRVIDMKLDCDQDALLVIVEPAGPACHTGTDSCFSRTTSYGDYVPLRMENRQTILEQLQAVIAQREQEQPAGAYTTYLFQEGLDKILKKVGEEAAEVIIAAKNRSAEELTWETADLLYHVLVLLQEQKVPLQEVLHVLTKRHREN